jgi:hypothetical protein
MQSVIRDYFENLYSNKVQNLEEMDKFLDGLDLPKLRISKPLKQLIANNEIEAVIMIFQKQSSPGLEGFSAAFYQTYKELTPLLLKLFHEL